jgi:hypothetical protein
MFAIVGPNPYELSGPGGTILRSNALANDGTPVSRLG